MHKTKFFVMSLRYRQNVVYVTMLSKVDTDFSRLLKDRWFIRSFICVHYLYCKAMLYKENMKWQRFIGWRSKRDTKVIAAAFLSACEKIQASAIKLESLKVI